MEKNCQEPPHYHFIGVGGIGMSGLAYALKKKGYSISGSDLCENFMIQNLMNEGMTFYKGHSPNWIRPHYKIVYNSSIDPNNPEIQSAKKFNCAIYHRSDILALLMHEKKSLAVTGTHGKTTTSGLLTYVLKQAYDASFFVGGILADYERNSDAGSHEYLIAEADESDGTFLKYYPLGAIVTNIDLDHMNYFLNEENLFTQFEQFFDHVRDPQLCFWCGDDPKLARIKNRGYSYGFSEECDLMITNYQQNAWKVTFDIKFKNTFYREIESSLLGKHNALNASAVFGLCLNLGMDENLIREGLKKFKGVARRCEKKGFINGALIIDDYAHHPTEIEATLQGIRKAIGQRKMIVVFQPHRYSRIQDCLGLFKNVFNQSDRLFITEIYAASEQPIAGITHEKILEEISCIPAKHVSRNDLSQFLLRYLEREDVLVTLGAGDITKLFSELEREVV